MTICLITKVVFCFQHHGKVNNYKAGNKASAKQFINSNFVHSLYKRLLRCEKIVLFCSLVNSLNQIKTAVKEKMLELYTDLRTKFRVVMNRSALTFYTTSHYSPLVNIEG